MKYNIQWRKKAIKQLLRIQKQEQPKIREAVTKLQNSATWGDVKSLVNHEYGYRLRVGSYRVLFNVTNGIEVEVNEITVEEVRKRDDRTYN